METGQLANFADLTLAFVGGLNDIGPLIPAVAPDIKMTIRIVLEDAGREARIDLGSRPPSVEFGEKTPPADITLFIKSRDFHEMLRGKLPLMKGWNEKKLLVEMTPVALAHTPPINAAPPGPLQVPGFVYESFLASVGAKRILEETPALETVPLEPRKKGLFEKVALAFAWFFGIFAGIGLRILQRYIKKAAASTGPRKVTLEEITEIPKPGKAPGSGKIARAIFTWFFDRVDMFRLARSFVGGARITANI